MATAAVGNATAVYTIPTGLQGTKSAKLRKVSWRNIAAGASWIHIGTGVGGTFADLIPAFQTVTNQSDVLDEEQIPDVESFANITAYAETLVGGGSIDIQIEVEERG
jgi:hypothetical protein